MVYIVVLLAVLMRFVPHLPNFSLVFGALLFGGANLKRRDALWFPVLLLAVSDFILTTQVYHMRFSWTQIGVWVGYVAILLIGQGLRNRVSVRNVLAASLASPIAFFLISNLAVWLGWQMYPPTWRGLLACYAAAVPFFRNSLVSSLVFTVLIFGGYELYQKKIASHRLHNSVARTS